VGKFILHFRKKNWYYYAQFWKTVHDFMTLVALLYSHLQNCVAYHVVVVVVVGGVVVIIIIIIIIYHLYAEYLHCIPETNHVSRV
jgi:hypothetical protein